MPERESKRQFILNLFSFFIFANLVTRIEKGTKGKITNKIVEQLIENVIGPSDHHLGLKSKKGTYDPDLFID